MITNVSTDEFELDPSKLLWATRLATAGVSSLWTDPADAEAAPAAAQFVVLRVEGHLHLEEGVPHIEEMIEIAIDIEQAAILTQLIVASVQRLVAGP